MPTELCSAKFCCSSSASSRFSKDLHRQDRCHRHKMPSGCWVLWGTLQRVFPCSKPAAVGLRTTAFYAAAADFVQRHSMPSGFVVPLQRSANCSAAPMSNHKTMLRHDMRTKLAELMELGGTGSGACDAAELYSARNLRCGAADFVTRQRCEAAVGLRTTAVYAAAALQRGLRKFRYVTKTRNRRNSLLTTAFHAVGLRPTAAGEQSSAPTEQSLLPCSAASAAVGLCNYFVTEGPSVPWASNCCRSYGF